MQKKCSNCGKEFEILYPELWRYKNGTGYTATEWFCRYNCMQEYRRREEEKKMARPKKDGTPARKPDRKPRMGTEEKLPDLPKVELVYDESIAEEYKREQAQKEANERAKAEELKLKQGGNYRLSVEETPETKKHLWKTAAVRNEILGVFYYDEKHNSVDWRHPMGEEISLPPADWNLLAQSLGQIMHVLGVENQEMEV